MNTTQRLTAIRELLALRAVQRGLLTAQDDPRQVDEAIEHLLEAEVITPEPTDEECSRFYATHPESFTSGELVFARHILFAITPGASISRIRNQAEKVLDEARSHPDGFAALAQQYSNCPSAQQGGSLGQLGRGECVLEFERELFEGRATGVLPRLVKTRFGFHIVAIDQRVPGRTVPYQEVRDQIAARLYARVQEKALMQYVQLLAGEYGVEIPGIAAAGSPLVQ